MERYYWPGREEDLLESRESDHALQVMRHRQGDRILLFDGSGNEWVAEVIGRQGRRLAFRRLAQRTVDPPPGRIAIAQALLKTKAMDLFFQKATELGVTEIFPVRCARSIEPGERASGKRDRWSEIVIAAAKQCRRAWLPRIHPPIALAELARESFRYPVRFFGSLREGDPPLRAAFSARRKEAEQGVLCLIGPEGDLTPAERTSLEEAGFLAVSLGPTVLRSETAALFCAAVFLYELAQTRSGQREEGIWQERS